MGLGNTPARKGGGMDKKEGEEMSENSKLIRFMKEYQEEYFSIIEKFFVEIMRNNIGKYQTANEFDMAIRTSAESLRDNPARLQAQLKSYQEMELNLKRLYSTKGVEAIEKAQLLNGCKLTLGGSSRFGETQLNAARRSLLFADCILIPDPVMPWIEVERHEERFYLIHPLRAVYFLLQLKDYIYAELDVPPFFIFPSWEKSLEKGDKTTQEQIDQICADIFSCYVDEGIICMKDAINIAGKNEDYFLERVDATHLLVAPGRKIGEPLSDALRAYKSENNSWRSKEWNEKAKALTDSMLALTAICERIVPEYHLLENADYFHSQPFICMEQPAYYHSLVSNMNSKRLENLGVADKQIEAILQAFRTSDLQFLSNIDNSQLIELRKADENIAFRNDLRKVISALPTSMVNDTYNVAKEICAHINSLTSSHKKELESIATKYKIKHQNTALFACAGLLVTISPALAPFIGTIAPFALAIKYADDKRQELQDHRIASRSLMGIISLAKKESYQKE